MRTLANEKEYIMSSDITSTEEHEYISIDVKIIASAEHIRARPGMYIGDCGASGLHHIVLEPVFNSIDQFRAGKCKRVAVELLADGGCCIYDDGPGIRVDFVERYGQRFVEIVLTNQGSIGIRSHPPRVACGLHGLGLVSLNALSERLEVRIARDGKIWTQKYQRGVATGPMVSTPGSAGTGTWICFWPDPQIFQQSREFDFALLDKRLRELAFLNPGLEIVLIDHRSIGDISDMFLFPQGAADFLEMRNRDEIGVHSIIRFRFEETDATKRTSECDIALQWTLSDAERNESYANSARTAHGGTHLAGFRQGVALGLRKLVRRMRHPRPEWFTIKNVVVGLKAITAVYVPVPQFTGATKATLANPEVGKWVRSRVCELLFRYLEAHPSEARLILERITRKTSFVELALDVCQCDKKQPSNNRFSENAKMRPYPFHLTRLRLARLRGVHKRVLIRNVLDAIGPLPGFAGVADECQMGHDLGQTSSASKREDAGRMPTRLKMRREVAGECGFVKTDKNTILAFTPTQHFRVGRAERQIRRVPNAHDIYQGNTGLIVTNDRAPKQAALVLVQHEPQRHGYTPAACLAASRRRNSITSGPRCAVVRCRSISASQAATYWSTASAFSR
jgi:hypothetical protein